MSASPPTEPGQGPAASTNPFESPAAIAEADIRAPGMLRRGRIRVHSSLSADDVKTILEDKGGYVVYETALIGADLVVKKSDWTGMALKVKTSANGTEILFNMFAPSMLVRLLFMGLIPLLILAFGAWKTFGEEFMTWVREERPFDV